MSNQYLVEPDVDFIKELEALGGDTLKKCFQCATCSVACPIAPDNNPFPRKEMIAASWGLKDKLVKNEDIWLCHNCGDCTTLCPRGAKPGEVLSAVRSYAITEYATPKAFGKMVNDPKKLPILFLIPVVIFIVLGTLTGLLNFAPGGDEVAHHLFFSTWLVDLIFVPLAIAVAAIFALGVKRFLGDIHENAIQQGRTENKPIDAKAFIKSLISILPTILKHDKFNECGENKERGTSHLLVFYSFVALFVVTNIFFVVLYVFQTHGPYSQLNPVKWLANIAGIALIIGASMMISSRRRNSDQPSGYKDWYLLGLVLGLGVTGMLAEATRLADLAGLSYTIYFLHLVFVFNLFAFLPFSKLAHLVYRTIAMTYSEYTGRK
ncbi:MAG: quinone-interacting membrane-bound oxidoreductase complex subunit QmoC [Desulfobacterales bacterium]|nr:quinone-interacting membrane-bound oxidoreductase complex subunit QmoC [Desulfobacterales bacterium]